MAGGTDLLPREVHTDDGSTSSLRVVRHLKLIVQSSLHVLILSDRSHEPGNASGNGNGTGTGSGKMGFMLEIEQYYKVRVRDQVRDRDVGFPGRARMRPGSNGSPTHSIREMHPGF